MPSTFLALLATSLLMAHLPGSGPRRPTGPSEREPVPDGWIREGAREALAQGSGGTGAGWREPRQPWG